MQPREIALLESFLSESGAYFEFGMGGSTCLAATLVRSRIDAVDTSPEWVANVRDEIGDLPAKSVNLRYIDVGPTGNWGTPLSKDSEQKFPGYSRAILETGFSDYDFCLVDGRFRVACFLQALSHLNGDAVIAVHDYTSRPIYHLIEPPRLYRRPFGLSYAAIAGASSMA